MNTRKPRNRNRRSSGRSGPQTHFDRILSDGRRILANEGPEIAVEFLRSKGIDYIHDAKLQHLYGRVLRDSGQHQEALKAFFKARNIKTSPKIEMDYVAQAVRIGTTDDFADVEIALYQQIKINGHFTRTGLMALGSLYEEWGKANPDMNELALVCYREAAEYNSSVEETAEDAAFWNLQAAVGHMPETREVDAIEDRLEVLGFHALNVR